jgi:hypothetical protein
MLVMKKLIVLMLLAGFILALTAAPASAAQAAQTDKKTDKKEEKHQPVKVFIPKEVKEPMVAGMAAKQARLDIPFVVFKTLYLPAKQAFHSMFVLKIKNSDLGFAPAAAQVVDPAAPAAAPKLKAVFNVFVAFYKVENDKPTTLVKEIYIPAAVEADQTGFDPAKEEWYTVGYPLMPGNYLASIAVVSQDLKKIGIQYVDVKLPDPKSFTTALDTTPIFFNSEYKQLDTPENKTELHKGSLRYSVLQMTPNIENVFSVGDNLDMIFYIFGTQPKDNGKYEIEINFEVFQGDKTAIKYATGNFESPLISLPLQMKQPLQIKKGEETRTEDRDLPAGSYTLVLKITDKVSGLKCEKKVDFTVK